MIPTKLSFILGFSLVACGGNDGDGTASSSGAATSTGTSASSGLATSVDTSTSTSIAGSTGATQTGANGSETAAEASGDPPDVCDEVVCDRGQECVGGVCVDPGTGGDIVCPEGETCQGLPGMMACVAPPTHCVLSCFDKSACPDSMECQDFFCQYPLDPIGGGFPPVQDPIYPGAQTCPEGFASTPFSVTDGFAVCLPECGAGQTCPDAASGSALAVCAHNPTNSGQPC